MGDKQHINVYAVGSMGTGKSTFLNFLLNDGKEQIFKTGKSAKSITKKIQIEEKEITDESGKTYNLRLHDTPGLNEVDELKDLNTMQNVFETFSKEKSISCVVICVSTWRLDRQSIDTIGFYSKLFKPLFDSGSIILLRTQLNNDDFLEMKEDGSLDTSTNNLLNELKKQASLCNNISFCSYINSKCSRDNNNDIDKYSQTIKSNIIEYFIKCGQTKMETHNFPLTPFLELRRTTELDSLNKVSEIEIKVTKNYNEEKARILQAITELIKKIAEKSSLVNNLEDNIKNLSNIVIKEKKTIFGRDWVKLSKEHIVLNNQVGFDVPHTKWRLHNCVPSIQITGTTVEITISTKILLLLQNKNENNDRWFAEVWLEKDGRILNEKEISLYNQGILSYKEDLLDLNVNLTLNQKTQIDKEEDIEKFEKAHRETLRKITILSLSSFNQSNIMELLSYLGPKV